MEEWQAQLLIIAIGFALTVLSSPMPSDWYPDHPSRRKVRGNN
jgi:hypothetical protein